LEKIRGKYDLLSILENFVKANKTDFVEFEETKTVARFRGVFVNKGKRLVHGWLDVGTYGVKTDIINLDTGRVDFKKTQKNAEIIPHYFCFWLPSGCDEGIAMLASYQGKGIKTLFYEYFGEYFKKATQLVIQMNPLSYDKALAEWDEANAREIRAINYVGFKDKADSLAGLGHEEIDLVLRPEKNGFLGKLKNLKNKKSAEYKVLESLTPLCSQVKAVLELGGKKRTFRIGPSASNSLCQIELDENVKLVGGIPELSSMHAWGVDLLNEFSKSVYKGQKVTV